MTSRRSGAERLSDLDAVPDLGGWLDTLIGLMSDGDPPVQRFHADQPLMRAGDPADCFLVILEGTATVLGASDDDASLEVGPGALLGELGVLFGGRRRRSVVATTPVIAVAGTRNELEAGLQHHAVGSHVASVAARRLAERVAPIPATTAKGLSVLLRPLLPGDRRRYFEALGELSLETLRKRFFTPRRPPDAIVERLIDIDYIDHVAWVAVDPFDLDARPLAVCRLIASANDPKEAEFAIGVVDTHQRSGVDTLLIGALGVVARERGLTTVTGLVLSDNRPMRAVCDKANASWTSRDREAVEARMLVDDVAALLDVGTAQRVAAATHHLDRAARLADA